MTYNLGVKGLLLYFFFIYCMIVPAQNGPKREFRGVWVATVMNIDWPSGNELTVKQQKREIEEMLDLFQSMNLNAVILQVRPGSDALYRSAYEPWSQYLNGHQGQAPDPLYDPLDYFIDGCHERGMELHAWVNPFRIKQKPEDELVGDHIFLQHPEWGWEYGSKTYLDPGIPEVRDYVVDIVKDIVTRYDIDAIHFDDYFYPYPVEGEDIPDGESFIKYNNGYPLDNIDSWRRNNINSFVFKVGQEIKNIKPWVQFGISPFGIWRNKEVDPDGSDTRAGITTYDALFADVLKWMRLGWVDYIVPQIYWQFGHPKADFETLANWWNEHTYNRNVYVGHGLYRINDFASDPAWRNPIELPRQIKMVRNMENLHGSVWFSSKHFFTEKIGFVDLLKSGYYNHKALVPTAPWIDNEAPQPPVKVKVVKVRDNNLKILWESPDEKNQNGEVKFYVIYRCKQGDEIDQNDSKYIFDVVKHSELLIRIPFLKFAKDHFIYRISCLDRLNNESELSRPVLISQ